MIFHNEKYCKLSRTTIYCTLMVRLENEKAKSEVMESIEV